MAKARILAVDDQLYFRVFLEDLLGRDGYEVRSAASPEEALDLLDKDGFDVVITDLVMPGVEGSEFVQQIKRLAPEQSIVVISGVGDLRLAVDAMKVGASDYLLKPIDASVLSRTLDGILERRRIGQEHERLMAENLEFMSAFSLYERALGLFAATSLDALADRITEGLCLETGAQAGVIWLARSEDPALLRLAAARGLVRLEQEVEELDLHSPPEALSALRNPGETHALRGEEESSALYLPLRQGARLLGVARLSDRLDGHGFGPEECMGAVKFASYAGQAVANALRFASLERRSFRDPVTKLYTHAYLEDHARNEIQAASRFGRSFSLVRVELEALGALRHRLPELEFGRWLESVARRLAATLRSTDLLAAGTDDSFYAFLPETEALGAGVLKRRMAAALDGAQPIRDLDDRERPRVLCAAASFPADGAELPGLWSLLDDRIREDRQSLARTRELRGRPFRGLLEALLEEATPGPAAVGEQMTRFLLEEVGRRPQDRSLLFVCPGVPMEAAMRQGMETLRGLSPKAEVVLVADRKAASLSGVPVTWVSPLRAGTELPFLIYYGPGAAYALVRDGGAGNAESAFFHTSDRVLVEELAFQLGRDLGIPIGA